MKGNPLASLKKILAIWSKTIAFLRTWTKSYVSS